MHCTKPIIRRAGAARRTHLHERRRHRHRFPSSCEIIIGLCTTCAAPIIGRRMHCTPPRRARRGRPGPGCVQQCHAIALAAQCARRHGNGKRVHFTRSRRPETTTPRTIAPVRILHSVFVLETRPGRPDYLGSFYASRLQTRGCRESDGRLKGTQHSGAGAPAVRCTRTLAQADLMPLPVRPPLIVHASSMCGCLSNHPRVRRTERARRRRVIFFFDLF